MEKLENKKTIVYSKEENQAILMIKKAIKQTRDSYLSFLAGGIVILLNNDLKKQVLQDIIKKEVGESEWQAEKRQHNRRVAACYTLATRRNAWFSESMTADDILKILKDKRVSAAMILDIEKAFKNPKDEEKAGKPEEQAGKPEEKEPEEPEEKDPESAENDKADRITLALGIRWLKGLTIKEREKLTRAMLESGYTFSYHKMTAEEKKQVANLYG